MKSEKLYRGIIYLRSSTEKQGSSLEEQLHWALNKAKELGVSINATQAMLKAAVNKGLNWVGDIYFDDAVSGADSTRVGFSAFLKRGMTDNTLTYCFGWARDRFSRPELAMEAIQKEINLLLAGRHTIFEKGHCCQPRTRFSSTLGEDMILLSEYQTAGAFRPGLSAGVLRGQGKNANEGRANGGGAPYGFRRACARKGSDKVEEIPDGERRSGKDLDLFWIPGTDHESLEKLEVVKWVFRVYFAGTHGLGRISRELNGKGIPSPHAGRMRKDPRTGIKRLVSGKWTVSNVRGVLCQPMYKGVYAWGRTEQGSLYRYDANAAGYSREVDQSELHGPNGRGKQNTGKKKVHRDREDWATCSPVRPFDPIVSPEVWDACYEQLKKAGEKGGLRGLPHHRDPDKYPVRMICDNCGEYMSGTPYRGEPCYICSSYSNSHGELCCHGWVQRDVVVQYAIRAIQAKIQDSASLDTLRKEIHRFLEEEKQGQANNKEIASLDQKVEDLLAARGRAYADMQSSTDPDLRDDARVFYKDISDKLRMVKAELTKTSRRDAMSGLDIEAETDAALALLKDLHTRLDDVPAGALREVFTALGVTVTVRFENKRIGQRQINPVHAEVRLGANGPMALPTLLGAPEGKTALALGKNGRGEKI